MTGGPCNNGAPRHLHCLLHPEVSPNEEHPPLNNSFIASMVLSSQLHKYLPSKRGSTKSRDGIFELPIKNSIGL
jgi:hypothetical protein